MVPHGPSPGNDTTPQSAAAPTPRNGHIEACTLPALEDALTSLLALDVADWPSRGLQVDKQRTVRTVLSGELAGVRLHLKVFRADKLSDRARDALRGPRGSREFHNLQRMRSRGFATVAPLACGMALGDGELRSFVATQTLLPAHPFDFSLPAKTLQNVGLLLRRLHDAGELIGDLHPGNLLVDAQDQPCLLDLTAVTHRGDLTLAERAEALAFFCQHLDGGGLDPRAAELMTGYLQAGSLGDSFERELMLATHRWRAKALPSFGRRAERACLHTELGERRRGVPRWHWFVGPGGIDVATRGHCQQFVAQPPPPDKTGRRGSVWLADTVVVKKRDKGAAQQLWTAAYWLLFADVDAPTPLALCTHHGQGFMFVRRCGTQSLAEELAAGSLDDQTMRATATRLARNLGRLHAHGLRNRDLKFENLVREPDSGKVHMVDLDGVRRNAVPDQRGAGADIGRLLAAWRHAGEPGGAPIVQIFLRTYLRQQQALLQHPPIGRILQRAERRAGEWRQRHR